MTIFLKQYEDSLGNEIFSKNEYIDAKVTFKGSNNKLYLKDDSYIGKANFSFTGNNATVKIGSNFKNKPHTLNIRIGEDSTIELGDGITIEKNASFFACEGTQILIGDDCMIASHVQIRADDSHPIFSSEDSSRINKSKDIQIGKHCWLGYECTILKGASISEGSVVGMKSIVTGVFPNNVLIAGIPGKIIKKNIAWERPNLATSKPPYKLDAASVRTNKKFWNLTSNNIANYVVLGNYKAAVDLGNLGNIQTSEDFYHLGIAYFRLGQLDSALNNFLTALRKEPRQISKFEIFKSLGNTLYRMRKFANAKNYFEQALLLDPFNLSVAKSLFLTYIYMDNVDKATELVKSICELSHQDQIQDFISLINNYVINSDDIRLKKIIPLILSKQLSVVSKVDK